MILAIRKRFSLLSTILVCVVLQCLPAPAQSGRTGKNAAGINYSVPKIVDFPERLVLEPASAENGNVERNESDRAYAARLSQLWLSWSFSAPIAHDGFKDPELARRWRHYFRNNRLALVDLVTQLREMAGLGNYGSSNPAAKFPPDEQLRWMHTQIQKFVSDQLALNEESRRLGQARREYCVTKRIPCMSSRYVNDLITNVPVAGSADTILSRTYFEALRPDQLEATIAKIILDYGSQNENLSAAWKELGEAEENYRRNARFYYEAEDELKEASDTYWKEIEKPSEALKKLKERLNFETYHAKRIYGKRTGFEQTSTFTDSQARIQRQTSRVAVIDRRLVAMGEQPENELSRQSMKILRDERHRRMLDIGSVEDRVNTLRIQYEKPPETAALRLARQTLGSQGREPIQRLHNSTQRLNRFLEKRDRLRDEHEAAETRYGLAVKKYREVAAGREQLLFRIKSRSSFEAERTDNTAKIDKKNDDIRAARYVLQSLEQDKEDERAYLFRANSRLKDASDTLVYGALYSVTSQAGLEAGSQILDMVIAGKKGGSLAAAASGFRDTLNNILNPKKIYDAQYDPKKRKIVLGELKDGYYPPEADSKKLPWENADAVSRFAAGELVKYLAGTGVDHASAFKPPNTRTKEKLTTKIFEKIFGDAKAAQKSLDNKTFKNGAFKASGELGKQALKGFVKSAAVDAIKRELAHFFEGTAHKDYSKKQWLLGQSVWRLREKSKAIQEKRAGIARLIEERDKLAQLQFDTASGFSIRHNEAFDVKPGLEVVLNFISNDEKRELVSTYYPGELTISLNGVVIERKPGTNIFVLGEDEAGLLRIQRDETLDLMVLFR